MTVNDFVAGWITVLSSFMAKQQYKDKPKLDKTSAEWMNEFERFIEEQK